MSSILSTSFVASTLFVGLSVLTIFCCICSFALFLFLHSATVFHICGWLQAANAFFLLTGILIFPMGWDSPVIKEVCGNNADNYESGDCSVRWAFILAIIGVIDCTVLSILAFVLGTRYVKLLPNTYIANSGETNSAYTCDSRKSSMPVMMFNGPVYNHMAQDQAYLSSQKSEGRHTPVGHLFDRSYSTNFQL